MDRGIDEVYLEKLQGGGLQESLHLFNKSGGYRRDNRIMRHNPARNSSAVLATSSPRTSLVSGTGPLDPDWPSYPASKNLNCYLLIFTANNCKISAAYPEIEASIMDTHGSIFA